MNTVTHADRVCPMCEKPIVTTLRGAGIVATCDCPTEGTFFTSTDFLQPMSHNTLFGYHKRAADEHHLRQSYFRLGFDAAMRVVHKFTEQHLPTVEKPGVD